METSEVSVFYYEIMKSNQVCQFYLLFKLKVKQSQQRFIPVPFVAMKATNQEMPYATFVQNLNGSNQ
jgi:hypothetical protein